MNESFLSRIDKPADLSLEGQQESIVENGVVLTHDDEITSVGLDSLFSAAPLPALPQSAVRLLEISQDPQKGPDDFAEVLQYDPALASQVLRFVNSSYFGFRNKLSSVKQGITLVGIRTIKNFVLWTAVFSTAPDPKCRAFALESFRHDALRRGLFAKSLGRLLDAEDLDETFTAALLQDIAVPFLVKEFPEQYTALLQQRKDDRIRLSQLEREKFGWTHSDAAHTLFERWNLPSKISDLVQSHTDVDKLIVQPGCKVETLAVALSSMLPADCDQEWHECERLDEYYRRIDNQRMPTLQELLVEVDQAFVEIATSLGVGANVWTLAERHAEALREAAASGFGEKERVDVLHGASSVSETLEEASMTSAMYENTAIYSTLGGDPDFAELVEMFVEEMPDRIAALQQAFDCGDVKELRCLAHQLKGAAGSFGLDQLTPLAAAVEFSTSENEPEEKIQKTLQELIGVGQQLRAGTPN